MALLCFSFLTPRTLSGVLDLSSTSIAEKTQSAYSKNITGRVLQRTTRSTRAAVAQIFSAVRHPPRTALTGVL